MRGTTPTISINDAIDLREAEVIYITFCQNDCVLFEKTKDDLTITENSLEFDLTQKETLMLDSDIIVEFQVRGRFPDGNTVKSNILKSPVTRLLKDGEI